jgi:serine/threonine-protein kinase RsbW
MTVAHELDMTLSPSDPDINALIDRLEVLFADNALPVALMQRFALAFDEIVCNIAKYGGCKQPIVVHVSVSATEVNACVSDDGVEFDPLQMPEPDTTSGIEERAVGGLGIFLVKKMMDSVVYERRAQHNHLSFAKRLAPAGAVAPDAPDAPDAPGPGSDTPRP